MIPLKKKALTHSHTNRDGWRIDPFSITHLLATKSIPFFFRLAFSPPLEFISEQLLTYVDGFSV